jgi:hypothetical protein
MINCMAAALAALLCATTVTSRLVVYGPKELKDKFEYAGKDDTLSHLTIDFKIPASFANFGNIPYGQSMVSYPTC